MKKFTFSLQNVLEYRDKQLEERSREYAEAIAKTKAQQAVLDELKEERRQLGDKLNGKTQGGITAIEMSSYRRYMKLLDVRIDEEKQILGELAEAEEERRQGVVEARREVASIDKLKEKRIDEYNTEVMKSEERSIEEFINTKRQLAQ